MDTKALETAIRRDREAGYLPAGVIACVGGTSVGASDDVGAVLRILHRAFDGGGGGLRAGGLDQNSKTKNGQQR